MTIQEHTSTDQQTLEQLSINTIRTLAMDGVQQANSGHPGTAMALAPLTYLLWTRFLKYNPQNPAWWNRDRFVLSAGHASMLLYSMLHLSGYDLPLEELKRFRQWESKTPGHPEYHHTPGVETTTGPLGQGVANAIGLAIGQRYQAERYNRPEYALFNHSIYAIAGDGDLMEGVASEAASLAGHLKLGKLIVFYDNNHITIEGDTSLAFTEDVGKRFESYEWHVQHVDDVNDLASLESAILQAQADERPSLIAVRTHIGFGSPNRQDSHKAHGEPLGAEEVLLTKRNLNWPTEEPFFVPAEALNHFRQAAQQRAQHEATWNELFAGYRVTYPELAAQLEREWKGELPADWEKNLPTFAPGTALASRVASGQSLNALALQIPNLVGGSADLAPSNNTHLNDLGDLTPTEAGRNMHFGVREHGMGGILNGIALYGGLIPFGATFLIFTDYMRPSIRLAALMRLKVVYVMTHDSIGLGEDGPTHQPIEQLAALRTIPGLIVMRPADANETVDAWKVAVSHGGPVLLALSRQNLPTFDHARLGSIGDTSKGAYILSDSEKSPELILMATGSEVSLALEAAEVLRQDGIAVRVISIPSWELFSEQSKEYQESVLPKKVTARLAIEAASPFGWERFVGLEGETITLNHFGASAPAKTLFQQFGFSVDNIVARARVLIGQA